MATVDGTKITEASPLTSLVSEDKFPVGRAGNGLANNTSAQVIKTFVSQYTNINFPGISSVQEALDYILEWIRTNGVVPPIADNLWEWGDGQIMEFSDNTGIEYGTT